MFNQSVKAIMRNSAPEPAKNTEENTEPHTQQQQATSREAGIWHATQQDGKHACHLSASFHLAQGRELAQILSDIFSTPIILKTGKYLARQTNVYRLNSAQNAEVRVSWNRFGGPVSNVCQSCRRAVCCKKSQWLKCTKANADTGGWQLWMSRRDFASACLALIFSFSQSRSCTKERKAPSVSILTVSSTPLFQQTWTLNPYKQEAAFTEGQKFRSFNDSSSLSSKESSNFRNFSKKFHLASRFDWLSSPLWPNRT